MNRLLRFLGEYDRAILAGLAVLGLVAACLPLGCSSPRIQPATTPPPAPVATVNEWGEVWRVSVSADDHEQHEYIGLLADEVGPVRIPPAAH